LKSQFEDSQLPALSRILNGLINKNTNFQPSIQLYLATMTIGSISFHALIAATQPLKIFFG
jgi:hypothetical protein